MIRFGLRIGIGLLVLWLSAAAGVNGRAILLPPADAHGDQAVFEVAAIGDRIWAGSAERLYFSDNGGFSWHQYDTANGFGRGSVTAMTVNDSGIWAATYYDTLINGFDYYINGGIYTSGTALMDWLFIDTPGRDDAGNITYDITVEGGAIWTANWWAGLKRSDDGGLNWESIVPDTGLFDPTGELHHRIFSVVVHDSIIWAGSQDGLNLSTDDGLTWLNLQSIDGQASLAADKIAALAYRSTGGGREIWAACWVSLQSGGIDGVSNSADTGRTWRTVLAGQRVWNFLFHDNDIFVAGESGLWFSDNDGSDFSNLTGAHIPPEVNVYNVAVTSDSVLWIGTSNGLYRGEYRGGSWDKVDFISLDASVGDSPRPMSFELGQNFPNPFNPETAIPVVLDRAGRIDLRVYDILGRVQKTIAGAVFPAGRHEFTWDGADDRGRNLPSGLYLYRLKVGDKVTTRKAILLR